MDGLKINQKIRFGYSKAAQKLGRTTALYRPTSANDPLNPANFIGNLPMVVSQDFTWMKANRPGNAYWLVFIDGRSVSEPLSAKEMDYLVDADNTYYILSKEFQLPMQAVQCNTIIKIVRPSVELTEGLNPQYSAFSISNPDTYEEIMLKIPCSILMREGGESAISKIPTDAKEPTWIVLLPHLDDVMLKTGDVIVDEMERQLTISVVEFTEFGFRLKVTQSVN